MNSGITDPFVTVVTITYNSLPFVKDTIESVLSQSNRNFEYLIIDDCSTDGTWELIESYDDPRVRSFRNAVNIREYPNRNKAIKLARGKYLIFIDGDDIMYPHALDTFRYYESVLPSKSMYISRDWDYRIIYPICISPESFYRFEFLDKGIMGGNFTKVFFESVTLKELLLPTDIVSGDSFIQLKIAQKKTSVIIPGDLTWWRRRSGNATEKFFSDKRHIVESVNYRLAFLAEDCPLTSKDLMAAKKNLIGTYLREVLRSLVKFKLAEVSILLRGVKIERRDFRFILYKSSFSFFNFLTGDSPALKSL